MENKTRDKSVIRLNIQAYDDRMLMVQALANSGYKCWCVTVEGEFSWEQKYYVYIGGKHGE